MPKLSKEAQKLPQYDLKAEREKHDMSQMEMARILFAGQASVARWESEGTLPALHRAYLALYWPTLKPKKKVAKAA